MTSPIAHIVVDLPLEGPFDYAVPEELRPTLQLGMRVMVPFGHRQSCGVVVGFADTSNFLVLKSIKSCCDTSPVVNASMLGFAKEFAAYYGCSLGQSLATMLPPLLRQGRYLDAGTIKGAQNLMPLPLVKPVLFCCADGQYDNILEKQISATIAQGRCALVLVPDIFSLKPIEVVLKKRFATTPVLIDDGTTVKGQIDYWIKASQAGASIILGMRSAVFTPSVNLGLAVMIDEENPSYKQEQSPLYETRDVLLMRARHQGFGVVFCSTAPSVELWHKVRCGEVMHQAVDTAKMIYPQAIDLTNYKFIPGMLSPPVRNALEEVLKARGKGIIVLNRRGSYRVSKCTDCGEVLKCHHCDSALTYSRAAKKFVCRHCAFTLPGDQLCSHCKKPSFKSFGMGVEQLQAELGRYFPTAIITSFERDSAQGLKNFDILITTQAVLRFKGQMKAAVVALIDFDGELNRMDVHSSFNAWALVRHLSPMALKFFFLQSRNLDHYVIRSLIRNDVEGFYEEELALRKELGFAPFKHWVQVAFRSVQENSARTMAQHVYNEIINEVDQTQAVAIPTPDAVTKKRGQYRFNVMVQGDQVMALTALVKAALARVKRSSRVIVTLNVDP